MFGQLLEMADMAEMAEIKASSAPKTLALGV